MVRLIITIIFFNSAIIVNSQKLEGVDGGRKHSSPV